MNKTVLVLLLLCTMLVTMTGAAFAQEMDTGTFSTGLVASDFAEAAGLGGVSGSVTFDSANASLFINLIPNGASLPEGVVLEGWVVDVGRFALSDYNASVADQLYGPPFGNLAFDVLVSAAPYSLSTGLLQEDTAGNWSVDFHVPNYHFGPYDAVVITAESDGNAGDGWDPRPGAPFFGTGMTEMNAELEAVEMEVFGMIGPATMAEAREPIEVTLGVTPFAADAGLEAMTGSATLLQRWQQLN